MKIPFYGISKFSWPIYTVGLEIHEIPMHIHVFGSFDIV